MLEWLSTNLSDIYSSLRLIRNLNAVLNTKGPRATHGLVQELLLPHDHHFVQLPWVPMNFLHKAIGLPKPNSIFKHAENL